MQIASSLFEKLSCQWSEFKLTDLFDVYGSKTTPKSKLEKIGFGKYPYITTQGTNNGVAGYYDFFTEFGNCLTIDSAVLGTCFYQSNNFSASDHVEILRPKFKMEKDLAIYFCAILNKNAEIYGYSYTKKRSQRAIKKEKLLLPTKESKIDFNFMINFVKEIKNAHTQKLINYYKFSMLNEKKWGGFELNEYFEFKNLEFIEFQIGDLFEVKSNPQLNKSSFNFNKNGKYPYFTRTVFNNGFLGYVDYYDEKHKIKGNCIAVGMIAMQFFYMKKDFYAGQFTKTIFPKFDNFDSKIALYFISIFNANKEKFLDGFNVKNFENKFLNTKIPLPTKNKKIDFEFIKKYISKIQKNSKNIISINQRNEAF